MAWRWNARRLIVSAFVIFHSRRSASGRCLPATSRVTSSPYQVLRAADRHVAMVGDLRTRPVRNTMVLDAEIVDAKGMRHIHEFPRLGRSPLVAKGPTVPSAQVHGKHDRA